MKRKNMTFKTSKEKDNRKSLDITTGVVNENMSWERVSSCLKLLFSKVPNLSSNPDILFVNSTILSMNFTQSGLLSDMSCFLLELIKRIIWHFDQRETNSFFYSKNWHFSESVQGDLNFFFFYYSIFFFMHFSDRSV
jgi:hypothetical protein